MAGHSHWAGIKHKKGRADKERSKIFSKLSREITVAAKLGDKDKSDALRRLHSIAVDGESKGNPIDFLQDLIDSEWNHSEKNGGKTFLGNVVKGVTRKLMDTSGALYAKSGD